MANKITAFVLAGLTLATPAFAADLPSRVAPPVFIPPTPVFTWTGCTVGVTVGVNSRPSNSSLLPGDPNSLISFNAGNVPPTLPSSRTGVTGGGGVGCKYQLDRVVVGADTDLSYTDLRRTSTFVSPAGVTNTLTTKSDYLGTARLSLGLPIDRVLLYVTGGLAYGNPGASALITPPGAAGAGAPALAGNSSPLRVGYTVGAGLAYRLTDHFILKAEYLYYDLGTRTLTTNTVVGTPAETIYVRTRENGHIGRVGLDYMFDFAPLAPVVARY